MSYLRTIAGWGVSSYRSHAQASHQWQPLHLTKAIEGTMPSPGGEPRGLDRPVRALLDRYRSDAARRRDSLGPLVKAVGVLRVCCETLRLLLDEIELDVGVHLELLDAVIRKHDGSRWWDRLAPDASDEAGER